MAFFHYILIMAWSAEMYKLSESDVFFVIHNRVNPDCIIRSYHLELTATYEMILIDFDSLKKGVKEGRCGGG
jgi:hypothetical protein